MLFWENLGELEVRRGKSGRNFYVIAPIDRAESGIVTRKLLFFKNELKLLSYRLTVLLDWR